MLLEKQLDQAITTPQKDTLEQTAGEFWLQETVFRGARRSIIHVADCPECETRKYSSSDQWHGPFADLNYARERSDSLSGVAIRAECRCVRRGAEAELPRMALLNEPLFRRVQPAASERKSKAESAKAAVPPQKKKPGAKKKAARRWQYGVMIGSAATAVCLVLLFLPALSVVQAKDHGSSPFLLANASHVAVTGLNADCSVELEPAAVHLQSSHHRLADRLGPDGEVSVPCFQTIGGATPQTSGMTMRLKLSYVLLGMRHVEQTFTFVAARNSDGVCRWVEKSQL